MTNEEFVEEVYYKAHQKGVFKEFSNEVTQIKKVNDNLSLCDAVEIVERKFKLI
jgi:hypothetical protein